MQDVMLDLETMGNGPNAAIVAVGAIEFDAATNTLGQQFYRGVNLETAVAEGGVIDASTVMWWLRQSDEARKDICGDGLPLRQVLSEFSTWLASLGEGVKVWGNGAAFDNVILSQAYRHTSNCCGEFIAYQAGRKAALLEAAERIARLRLGVVNPDWACGRDDAYNEVLRMTGKEMW